MPFVVTIAPAPEVPVEVTYATANGSATGGEDYQSTQGTLAFPAGTTQQNVIVNVIGDTNFEPDETFTLAVTPPGGSAVAATGTILNDDARSASRVTIVSGNNQQGRPGQPLPEPLIVQVLDEVGGAVAGAVVQWQVTRGDAELDPATSTTGADGRASTNVNLRSVGPIDVEARVGELAPVTFSLNSQTGFESRAEGPVAVPVARALDQVCASNDPAFAEACRALVALPDDDLTPALERVAPQQSGAQAKVASEIVSAVTSGVRARLSSLRGRTDRMSVQQLALNLNGRAVPVGALVHALFQQDALSDAGGEEPDYNGWSAFLSGNLGDGERIGRSGQLGFDLESQGLMFGADRLFGESVFGAAIHLMQLDAELSNAVGSLETSAWALSVYASRGGFFASGNPAASFDGVHFDGSLSYGRNTYDAEHNVDIAGLPLSRATSSNDASVFAVSGGTGIEAHRGRTDFDFSLAGTWSRTDIDALTEEGSGPLILFVQGQEIDSLVATAGLNVRSAFAVPFGTLLPSVRAEMIHELRDGARLVTARFLRDRQGTSFTVPLDQPDANYGKLGAGLQGVFPYGYSASVEVTQDVLRSDLHFRTLQFTVYKSF
jgi:outer membrane autotransporter protein